MEHIHAGIDLTAKHAETVIITGADIIADRKSKPSTSKEQKADPSSSSKAKPETNPKKSTRIGIKSAINPPNPKVNAESDLHWNKEAMEPRERFRDTLETDLRANVRKAPGPNSSMTGPDILSSVNTDVSMPGSSLSSGKVTGPSPSVIAELMPSTSFAGTVYSPGSTTQLKTVLESKILTIKPEEVPGTNRMTVRSSVKREKPSTSLEMDLICTLADPQPMATESAAVISEASNRQKVRS